MAQSKTGRKIKTSYARNGKNNAAKIKNMDFVAVDVETANSDVSSICQIGVAVVRSAKIEDVWTQLIDPEDFFDPYNIAVHGIDQFTVRSSPRFKDLHGKIARYLKDIVVSHTLFDRRAIQKAYEAQGKSLRYRTWIDSAQVARRAWPEKYAERGYSLGNIAGDLGIAFRHHDAGEDARAAAEIILRACESTGLAINQLQSARDGTKPARSQSRMKTYEYPNPAKPLSGKEANKKSDIGEVIVFTGTLSIPRREAAALATVVGYKVEENVTERTSILIVGEKRKNLKKSSKHKKAEDLIQKGKSIRIMKESSFSRLIS